MKCCDKCGNRLNGSNYCNVCKRFQVKKKISFNFVICFTSLLFLDIIFWILWTGIKYMSTSCDLLFGCLEKSLSLLVPIILFVPSLFVVLLLTGIVYLVINFLNDL